MGSALCEGDLPEGRGRVPVGIIHIACGSTGAGKTSHALVLGAQLGGVRFSIDQWMATLFWMDGPQPLVAAWAHERVGRCTAMIWATASQVAAQGVPCILDLGFTTRAARRDTADKARAAGLGVRLHWLDVPADECWRRVCLRNDQPGATRQLAFAITRAMFDYVETLWQPPDADEMRACDGVRISL